MGLWVSGLSPQLITHALSSEHMENQLASSGEKAKAPLVTALCWLIWDMGLLSIYRKLQDRLFSLHDRLFSLHDRLFYTTLQV